MKAFFCDKCGGNEFVKQGDFFICEYCGSKFLLPPEERRKDEAASILANAKSAFRARSYEACQISCAKVLNSQPDNPVAIYLRGACEYHLGNEKTEAERMAWQTACSTAESYYKGTDVPLDLAVTGFTVAINIITEKKKRAIERNSAAVAELQNMRAAAKDREERMESDIIFRAANDFRDFLDDVSGNQPQKFTSSKELDKRIHKAKAEFASIEAKYVEEASDVIIDTWNLIYDTVAPIALLKAMKKTTATLWKSINSIRSSATGIQFEKTVNASANALKQTTSLINEAIIEAAEEKSPGTKADYKRYLADLNSQEEQRREEIQALEAELSGTKFREVKKQFTLRTKLASLRDKKISPDDPCAAYADMLLARFE